jgi:hypothetical protein
MRELDCRTCPPDKNRLAATRAATTQASYGDEVITQRAAASGESER